MKENAMLTNYLKTAFRNLLRQQLYVVITIGGLAVGMACCILILLYVRYELSYDKFHKNRDSIFRIIEKDLRAKDKRNGSYAQTSPFVAPVLIKQFPEVINAVRIFPTRNKNSLITFGDISFNETGIFADDSFFDVFSFKLIEGSPQNALKEPFTVLISESFADKYFNGETAFGKVLTFNARYDLKISGIFEDIPDNSHIRCNFIISYSTLSQTQESGDRQSENTCFTYVTVFDKKSFEEKLALLSRKLIPGNTETEKSFVLQSLKDIHFGTHVTGDMAPHNDINNVYFLISIAVIILIVACINYMNLATARSSMREREVGVRKVVGAKRLQLINQFIGESVIIATIAIVFALAIVELILPSFGMLVNKNLEMTYFKERSSFCMLAGIVLFVGFLAGSYPALFLSAFKPIKAIKGILHTGPRGSFFRNAFFIIQFVISIVFIAITLIIHNQLLFMKNTKKGYSTKQMLIIPVQDNKITEKYELVKNDLLQQPGVAGVTASACLPNTISNQVTAEVLKESGEKIEIPVYSASVDYEFMDIFKIKLIEGRNFSGKFKTDISQGIIINETAVKTFGWKEPVGKMIQTQNMKNAQVIGVVNDFHFLSLHNNIEPMIFRLDPGTINYLSVKIKPGNVSEITSSIEKLIKNYSPHYHFEYYFLDDSLDSMYSEEQKLGTIFGYVSVLALCIACFGLFGLVSFTIEKRTKEIGIRKALGATVFNIIMLFTKDFLKLVILANIIAWPLTYAAMTNWLENFAYRTNIGLLTFIVAALYAFIIVLVTVGSQAAKTAVANPIDSLRYE